MIGAPDHRLAALEGENERLRGRVAELEALLVGDFEPPVEWCLPRREAQIFSLLVRRDRVTKDMLCAAFRDEATADTDPAVWESHVSKMRRRLAPFGVEIECKRHLGYRLIDRARFQPANRSVA